MNPQRGAHMGAQPQAQPPLVKLGPGSAIEGIQGTQASGYEPPNDLGEFECENCAHYQPDNPEYPKACDHPKVIADPEVDQVDPEGCCEFVQRVGKVEENETEELGESDALHESPER